MSVPFKFIHAADLHLDSPFRGLSKAPEPVREELAKSTFAALRRLTELALSEEVDFIVIAGDLFDEADRSLRAQLALLKEWETLAAHGIAIFAIHGNHDHLGGKRARLNVPPSVHIFGAGEMDWRPAYRRSGELAAYIYGVSYGERAVAHNLAAGYRIRPEAPYHIALLHANVGGDRNHDPYAPCSLEELTGSGFQYWALGHIHKRGILHTYPHVVYSGNTQGRHPRETGAKGCYVVNVSPSGETHLAFEPLDSVRWLEAEATIEGLRSEGELLDRLLRTAALMREDADNRSVMLRLTVTGRGDLHHVVREPSAIAALLERLQSEDEPLPGLPWLHVYHLEADTGANIDWQELERENSFAGELMRLTRQLESDPQGWRALAGAALEGVRAHNRLGRFGRDTIDEPPGRWLQQARELTLGLIANTSADTAENGEGRGRR